jgi:hypothetical protein
MSGFTETNANANNNLLETATLSFHNGVIANVASANEIQIFGMLKIQAAALTKVLTKMLRIVMIIDLSGSMDDLCKDKKSQIHHMRVITRNLIKELHKFKDSDTQIQFVVKGFETKVHHIMDVENLLGLSEEQIITEIMPKIDKLESIGWTNLEAALKEGRKCVSKIEGQSQDIKNMIVLITDGDANQGETRPAELRRLMPSNCKNVILGLGVNYDVKVLQKISDGENKHINDPESAGNCVGEIIHKFMFEALTNVEIIIQNGLIFNYANNTWSNHLFISNIASEETKNFSIMSSTPDAVVVKIRCAMNGDPFEYIISENDKSDLTMFQFRQKVQESMYKAKELELLRNEMQKSNYSGDLDYIIFGLKDEDDLYSSNEEIKERKAQEAINRQTQFDKVQTEFKAELKQLLIKMLRYMNDNDLNNDAFYKTLCMDIKVTMDSLGRKNAEVYITSRITSQGRQDTYTCDAVDDNNDNDVPTSPRGRVTLTRQTAACNNDSNSDSDSDSDCDYDAIQRGPPSSASKQKCRAAPCFNSNIQSQDEDKDENDDEAPQKSACCFSTIQAEEEEEEEEEEEDKLLANFNKSIKQNVVFDSPYSSPQKLSLMRGVSSQQEDEEEVDDA